MDLTRYYANRHTTVLSTRCIWLIYHTFDVNVQRWFVYTTRIRHATSFISRKLQLNKLSSVGSKWSNRLILVVRNDSVLEQGARTYNIILTKFPFESKCSELWLPSNMCNVIFTKAALCFGRHELFPANMTLSSQAVFIGSRSFCQLIQWGYELRVRHRKPVITSLAIAKWFCQGIARLREVAARLAPYTRQVNSCSVSVASRGR